jgi:hypothetical protein
MRRVPPVSIFGNQTSWFWRQENPGSPQRHTFAHTAVAVKIRVIESVTHIYVVPPHHSRDDERLYSTHNIRDGCMVDNVVGSQACRLADAVA